MFNSDYLLFIIIIIKIGITGCYIFTPLYRGVKETLQISSTSKRVIAEA